MKKKIVEFNFCDRVVSQHRYGLTFDQQEFLESNSNRTDILILTRECFKDITLDEHSDEFSNIKKFLLKVKRGNDSYNFNTEQLKFIEENGPNMRPIDIARALFPTADSALVRESQSIAAYCKAKDIQFDDPIEEKTDEVFGNYEPPRSDHKIIAKINQADINAGYHIAKLDPKQKECISALKKNLNSPRFVIIANSIKRAKLREFFEVEFIRSVYDKPDLNADETNTYISLCKAYVDEIIIWEIIAGLNDRLSEVISDDDKDGKKFAMTLSESLDTKTREAKECRAFIHTLQKSLSGSRASRIENLKELNQSLAKFVQVAEYEKGREKYTRVLEARLKEVKEEADKIAESDDLVAEIFGIDIEELIKF